MLLFGIIGALIFAVLIFLKSDSFGKLPSGDRKSRILLSPNYKDGKFQNLSQTPDLTEGVGYFEVLKEFLFEKNPRSKPERALVSEQTDLKSLSITENVLVWFGHSSYFLQVDSKRFLVDPVFSGAASPIAFTTPSFEGSDAYTVEDMPEIDVLFISHDHWDHLDFETVQKLQPKVKRVICGLGVGAHLEHWGYTLAQIIEKDWHESENMGEGFKIYTAPTRHFSGRGLQRNQSLWMSFILQTPTQKIYLGGDSGYDTHFAAIGKEYGTFDLVILEFGQYDKSWKYIHLMPDEILKAFKDLNAQKLLTVHWSKFALANHAWDEPIKIIKDLAQTNHIPLLTPMIGEKLHWNVSVSQLYEKWE